MAEKKINRRTIVTSKITRKVISKVPAAAAAKMKKAISEPETEITIETEASGEDVAPRSRRDAGFAGDAAKSKKACYFCQSKVNPTYTDINNLRRFLTDRAKIQPSLKSGLCSKHQRVTTRQIKYARHLALLPFIPKV